jgi:two-component system sensor histidine kinase DegS
VLERESLLDSSAERERELVSASERRMTRVGFDLHDGALQEVSALATDLRLVRSKTAELLGPGVRGRMLGCFDDLEARLGEIDSSLRNLAHSLESSSASHQPLAEVLHRECESFRVRSGIDIDLRVSGSLEEITDSQKIAIFRIVQEALTNVREHSGARNVVIDITAHSARTQVRIEDNGRGFDADTVRVEAARRGRLGLVGISERVRLLGGASRITSQRGGPTALSFTLPRWVPVLAAEPDNGGGATLV